MLIKRDDGAWFVGRMADGEPYEAFGPLSEATARAIHAAEHDLDLPVLDAREAVEAARDQGWAEGALLWTTEAGDGDAFASWTWQDVEDA